MGVLTVLGAVFSSWRIYMLIGAALAAAALFGYVEYLRADAANAHAQNAALISAHQTDAATIQTLQTVRAADETALAGIARRADSLSATLADIKDKLHAIPKPKTCNSVDARDRAAIDGVRRLVAPDHANANHQGAPSAFAP